MCTVLVGIVLRKEKMRVEILADICVDHKTQTDAMSHQASSLEVLGGKLDGV
jgi:hypothetical protein